MLHILCSWISRANIFVPPMPETQKESISAVPTAMPAIHDQNKPARSYAKPEVPPSTMIIVPSNTVPKIAATNWSTTPSIRRDIHEVFDSSHISESFKSDRGFLPMTYHNNLPPRIGLIEAEPFLIKML